MREEGYPRYPYEERETELPIEWSGAIRLWITGAGRWWSITWNCLFAIEVIWRCPDQKTGNARSRYLASRMSLFNSGSLNPVARVVAWQKDKDDLDPFRLFLQYPKGEEAQI